jgi:hypothetical protein
MSIYTYTYAYIYMNAFMKYLHIHFVPPNPKPADGVGAGLALKAMGVIGFAATEGVAGTLNPNPVEAAGAVSGVKGRKR